MIRSRGVGIGIDTLIQNAGIPSGSLTCRTTLASWSQVKVIPFFFLKIYLKFRVIYRGGDREIFYSPVHSPGVSNGQGQAKAKPGARIFF